jgi:hypothetical protein
MITHTQTHPKAAREVIVSFADADKFDLAKEVADKALTEANSAFLNSNLKRPFHGARFSIAKNLILITALHETSADLEIYRPIITEALKFIGPAVAKIPEPWTKFILHGVPTYLELEEIRRDVEDWNPKIKLCQTPRWLATVEKREGKPVSSVVLALPGSVTITSLGVKHFVRDLFILLRLSFLFTGISATI